MDSHNTLTIRERQVLPLVANGCTNREIALQLGISPRTVEIHRANVMYKLGLHTTSDLLKYALRHGIISLD